MRKLLENGSFIRNDSRLSDDKAEELVKKYLHPEARTMVIFRNHPGYPMDYRGYGWGQYITLFGHTQIEINVPQFFEPFDLTLPYTKQRIHIETFDQWIELLVAHETRHAWQHQVAGFFPDRLYSEIDAENYTIEVLGLLRKENAA